ncbi:MAG TPA: CPBP family intramembrane glutamic endopeptidase [Verrucomicrobiae bacterium]|nr:CPBP family intramembrane glutamic endopeptidase [Verrucomicrobiae bacterium]
MSSNPFPVLPSNRSLTILAWTATILVSTLPDIIWIELAKGRPGSWVLYDGKIGLMLAPFLAACVWKPLRPLRNFFLVMFAFFVLSDLRTRLNFTWPALQAIFGGHVFDARMQAEQTGKLAVSLATIALLFVLGYRRRESFLMRGDLRTPIEPVPWLGFPKPDPWLWFGLQWSVYIAAALAVMQYLSLRPTGAVMLRIVPMLPSILFYAALNAFNEEITFRVPMLATLEPVGGSKQALWMSSYFFGIAHYFGTPGGVAGGIASIFMGWILGKAMVETRGLFWAWWIHFLSDIAIFTFLGAALVK